MNRYEIDFILKTGEHKSTIVYAPNIVEMIRFMEENYGACEITSLKRVEVQEVKVDLPF